MPASPLPLIVLLSIRNGTAPAMLGEDPILPIVPSRASMLMPKLTLLLIRLFTIEPLIVPSLLTKT